jgi:hypothetical protein
MISSELIEEVAKTIYCDSYTQYGTCTPEHWKRTSEVQRNFCRGQARAVLDLLVSKKLLVTPVGINLLK